MTLMPMVALAVSAILLILLCRGDPKRRRTTGVAGEGQNVARRRLLAAGACLPGIGLALTGHAAGFMIWLGGCAVIGWLVALGFGQSGQDTA